MRKGVLKNGSLSSIQSSSMDTGDSSYPSYMKGSAELSKKLISHLDRIRIDEAQEQFRMQDLLVTKKIQIGQQIITDRSGFNLPTLDAKATPATASPGHNKATPTGISGGSPQQTIRVQKMN